MTRVRGPGRLAAACPVVGVLVWCGLSMVGVLIARADGAAGTEAEEAVQVLVFRDGDRLRGRVVSESDTEVVFASIRFGTIAVARGDLVEIEASAESDGPAATTPTDEDTTIGSGPDGGRESSWLHLWKATLALSAEGKREGDQRSSFMVEARIGRSWTADEVRFGARYEFAREGERTTDDLIEFEGYARHDFRNRWFVLYSPELDWNRGYVHQGTPLEYVWLQQEIGAGLNALDRPGLMLRLGVAENLFNVWTIDRDVRVSTHTESIFTECEWQLPWAVKLTDRFRWYYSLETGENGFENQFDLSKQLTANLHLGFRHEAREEIPNADVGDYTLWRILLGLDF